MPALVPVAIVALSFASGSPELAIVGIAVSALGALGHLVLAARRVASPSPDHLPAWAHGAFGLVDVIACSVLAAELFAAFDAI